MQDVINELLHGFGILSVYFIIAASTVLLCRFLIRIPNEIFRKTLHFVLLGSVFVFVYGFKTWWVSAFSAIIFEVIVFPILMVVEHIKNFSEFTTERKKGELKNALGLICNQSPAENIKYKTVWLRIKSMQTKKRDFLLV